MIPLRLDIDEKTSLKIHEAPQSVKDAIEERHNLLLQQVRHFYTEKQRELAAFIDRVFTDHEAAKAREAAAIVNEQDAASSLRIKSIVKRQPSTSEKRVSFSSSPPRVELFKKDTYEEEDEDSHNELRPPVVAPNGEAVGYRSYKSALPLYRFPSASTSGNNSTSAIHSSASEASDSSAPGSPNTDGDSTNSVSQDSSSLSNSSARDHSPQSPTPPLSPTDSSHSVTKCSPKSMLRSPEMFPFEDTLEPPSIDSDPASEHHSSFRSPDFEASDSFSSEPVPLYEELSEDSMIVGSAPIQIAARSNFYEADGGKSAPYKAEKLEEEAEDRDLAISCKPDDVLDLSSNDPSQMSFRQRMEWENIRSLRR